MIPPLFRLLPAFVLCLTCGARADILKFEATKKSGSLVADPAASQKRSIAVNVESEGGRVVLGAFKKPLPPGLYRFSPRLRAQLPADYEAARLRLNLHVMVDGKAASSIPMLWLHFNAKPGQYTQMEQRVAVPTASTVSFELSWNLAPLPAGEKTRAVRPVKPPSIEDASADPAKAGRKAVKGRKSDVDEFTDDLNADVAVAPNTLDYPAVLIDGVDYAVENAGLVVEKVWPEKVHVHPGEANPVEVTVHNFKARPEKAVVRLEMLTGLDEAGAPLETVLSVPAHSSVKHRFEWTSGRREFGHEARASVRAEDGSTHSSAEYFSVGAPVWKTAIQGSGFLTWYGREASLKEHVAENRAAYVNVEEAFSWQPSSWTDLNPEGDHWWTGQGNAHNSLAGLKIWMDASHSNGIKMITYSWPTASGPSGMEWARRHPDLITHGGIGLASEFHDIEDLKLYDLTHSNSLFWRIQYGVWHSMGINRGYFETINLGAEEIIKSARKFGWDGVRFDKPPGWSAMDAAEGIEDLKRFGVVEKMRSLLPELFEVKEGNWDGDLVSKRNLRWMRHRFQTEIEKPFAVSFNFGVEPEDPAKPNQERVFFNECAGGGGQMMNEAIRLSQSWEKYRQVALKQAEAARTAGGFDTIFCPDAASSWGRTFAAIFTFASGSHTYNSYGWGPNMPGTYSQFMTRFGEFCWDLAFAPAEAEQAAFTLKSESPLLWKDYVRARTLEGGRRQTVVHLVTPPPVDAVVPAGKNGVMPAWQSGVTLRRKGARPEGVWLLSAEPATRSEKLTAVQDGDGFAVSVPEHRYWSVLVWQDPAR